MKRNKIVIILCLLVIGLFLFLTFDKNNETVVEENGHINIKEENVQYKFRNDKLLKEHYEKHGKDMGYSSKEEYESAASKVANNDKSLHKKESEDNDDVYYLEDTNEFVVVSTDGYIRTYFKPDAGKKYFDKQ